MHVEESMSLLCLHCHPSISLTMHPFFEMGCPCECKAISCRQPTQYLPPGLLPSPLLCCLNMGLIFKVHMLTQKLFNSLSLAPICGPHNGTFQQGSNHLAFMMDGDPAQSSSQSINLMPLYFETHKSLRTKPVCSWSIIKEGGGPAHSGYACHYSCKRFFGVDAFFCRPTPLEFKCSLCQAWKVLQ